MQQVSQLLSLSGTTLDLAATLLTVSVLCRATSRASRAAGRSRRSGRSGSASRWASQAQRRLERLGRATERGRRARRSRDAGRDRPPAGVGGPLDRAGTGLGKAGPRSWSSKASRRPRRARAVRHRRRIVPVRPLCLDSRAIRHRCRARGPGQTAFCRRRPSGLTKTTPQPSTPRWRSWTTEPRESRPQRDSSQAQGSCRPERRRLARVTVLVRLAASTAAAGAVGMPVAALDPTTACLSIALIDSPLYTSHEILIKSSPASAQGPFPARSGFRSRCLRSQASDAARCGARTRWWRRCRASPEPKPRSR